VSTQLKNPVSKTDHSSGPDKAPAVLVEYGDFQCPHCRAAFPIVKRLQKALGANLKFVFRNFPLSEVHPDALNAAKAAEAASLQEKFWEMHDLIYENQENLDAPSLLGFAEKLKLDLKLWKKAVADPAIQVRVEKDFEGGVRSGVNGTPSFFVNGFRYDGDWDYGTLLKVLEKVVEMESKS
jgi:protein-disulfide isomerase